MIPGNPNDPLEEFRCAGRCEWCKRWFARRDPAHIVHQGMGGRDEADPLNTHRWNRVGLCRICHCLHHDGHEPRRFDLITLVAQREGVLQDEVEKVLWSLKYAREREFHATGADDLAGRGGDGLPGAEPTPGTVGFTGLSTDEEGWTEL